MRISFYFLILVVSMFWSLGNLQAITWQEASSQGEYRQAIALLKAEIVKTENDKGANTTIAELLCEESLLFLRDQKEEEAFLTFQKAISLLPRGKVEPCEEEQKLFQGGLKIYFSENEKSPYEVAKTLDTYISPLVTQYPKYATLQLLQALARANQHRYDDFFSIYFHAYTNAGDCYLIDKTAGIIAIKLFEKARTTEEKAAFTKQVMEHLAKAQKKETADISLYRMMVLMAPPNEKKATVAEVIDRIVANNVVIPRKELPFYVLKAVEYKEIARAKTFLQQAKGWYQYSRTIDELESICTDADKDGG